MELFILGLAIGGAVGAGGKRILKTAAKAYLAVSDKTQEVVEDFRRRSSEAGDEIGEERDGGADGVETLEAEAPASPVTDAGDGELNRTQAAALLSVPVSTLRYWERRGRLTPARREGVVCYTTNDIEQARSLIQGSNAAISEP